MKKYKVIFADLDGTLIETISGKRFPQGIWDMKFKFNVLTRILKMNPRFLFIVTNQGGIEAGMVSKASFETKMEYISRGIREMTKSKEKLFVQYRYCPTNDKTNYYRKPNVGMLQSMFKRYVLAANLPEGVTKADCLMIGDASGKPGQFSDSDKKTAENFGIDYMDVNDFLENF